MTTVAAVLAALLIAIQSATPPQGTIRGRILDADARPMRDVQVSLMELVDGSEFRVTRSFSARENGTFEIAVNAGRILLVAQPRPKVVGDEPRLRRFVTHPPAYFPGVLDQVDAWPIDVKPGEIIEFDFNMPPISVGSIKTIISGPDGYALEYVRVTRPEANQIKTVKLLDGGVGYTDGLREGRYIVSARARSRDTQLAAWEIVHMIAGEIAVSLDLEPTATIFGRIVSERDGLPPMGGTRVVAALSDGTIDLDPLSHDAGQVTADGSFTIEGVFGTRTFRVEGLDSGWQVIAIRQGRATISSSGLDLAPGATIDIAIVVARK